MTSHEVASHFITDTIIASYTFQQTYDIGEMCSTYRNCSVLIHPHPSFYLEKQKKVSSNERVPSMREIPSKAVRQTNIYMETINGNRLLGTCPK